MTRPHPLRSRLPIALAAPALAAVLGGCGIFASHNQLYPPVELSIGEPQVRGSDTVYAYTTLGYELVAPEREQLLDLKPELDLAVRSYLRYFGETPPRVDVEYALPQDTLAAPDPGVIRVPPPERDRFGGLRLAPVGMLAARHWLMTRARTTVSASDSVRVPYWLQAGMADLIGGSAAPGMLAYLLTRNRDSLLPLDSLFALATPDSLTGLEPRNRRSRSTKLEGARLAHAEALSLLQFISQKESPRFLGTLFDGVLNGVSIGDILTSAGSIPSDIPSLENAWKAWLDNQASEARPGFGG
ncbi:MAG: hypothetical protein AB7I33_09345 [Gemmatimonadales bacterium]